MKFIKRLLGFWLFLLSFCIMIWPCLFVILPFYGIDKMNDVLNDVCLPFLVWLE